MRGVLQAATVYDAFVGAFGLAGVGRLRRRLVGDLAEDILEIGVGTGLNLRHYGPRARVTGIEPAAALLRAAVPRARARGYPLARASAAALPFPDAAFDAVVSPLVFCSIPAPLLLPALAELRRVLRPGGRLLLLEHTRTGRPFCDAAIDAVAPLWLRLSGGCHLDRDTPALLERAGWRVARHERHALGLYRLLVAMPAPSAVGDVPSGAGAASWAPELAGEAGAVPEGLLVFVHPYATVWAARGRRHWPILRVDEATGRIRRRLPGRSLTQAQIARLAAVLAPTAREIGDN